MALYVGGVHNTVVCAKFAFGLGVKKRHVGKGTATNHDSSLTSDGTSLWLDRIYLDAEIIALILELQFCLLTLLFF